MLSIVACFALTKIYTASSTLVLERKDVRPFETDISTQAVERDKSAAETEMDVLRSRNFLGRVVDRLELISDPEFNPLANEPDKGLSEGAPKKDQAKEDGALPDQSEILRDRVISRLQSQVNVSRTGESLAVVVEVSSNRPEAAAKIANAIATMYVETSLEFKQSARTADKARAMQSGGAVAFLRERNTQPLLTTLRNEEARLARERDELASQYGKNHPKMVGYDSQIISVRRMIDDEVARILQDLEIEALKPSARVVSLAAIPGTPSFPKPHLYLKQWTTRFEPGTGLRNCSGFQISAMCPRDRCPPTPHLQTVLHPAWTKAVSSWMRPCGPFTLPAEIKARQGN
jgi:uncharacterized protein involved in exopolysaccharide biosynthesis